MLRAASFILSLILLSLCAACSGPPPPEKTRVLLIGIDGATWQEIYPLADKGRLPHLSALVTEGSLVQKRPSWGREHRGGGSL